MIDSILNDNLDLNSMGIINPIDCLEKVIELKSNPKLSLGLKLPWYGVDFRLVNGINIVTGIPGCGKSVWLDNVILHSMNAHQWKWCIFSPENAPIERHIRDMVEIITQSNFYGYFRSPETSNDDIVKAVHFLNQNIMFYHPKEDESLKIENILATMKFLNEKGLVNAFLLDPYNEFSPTRNPSMSETEYVSHFLSQCRKLTRDNEMSGWIVAHPRIIREKNEEGGFAVPTAYDISGSANWFAKADTIVCVHRDKNPETNPNNETAIHIQKLKKKDWGQLGEYKLQFDRGTNIFKDVPKIEEGDVPDYDKQTGGN